MRSGASIKSVGQPVGIGPFDEFGRRNLYDGHQQGDALGHAGHHGIDAPMDESRGHHHVWDMRIATSSIPRDMLQKILLRAGQPEEKSNNTRRSPDSTCSREHYGEARQIALESSVDAFPERDDLKEELARRWTIGQLSAQRLAELQLRRNAGQYELVARATEEVSRRGC